MKKILIFSLAVLSLVACRAKEEPEASPKHRIIQGMLSGRFSVSDSTYAFFSQGNLQFNAVEGNYLDYNGIRHQGTWRLAPNQWDAIGDGNKNIAPDYDGWIDLFGWGTGDEPTKAVPYLSEYTEFTNWGYNHISNGGNKTGLWTVLSKDQMEYLLFNRPNAKELHYYAAIDTINGIALLPDDWTWEDKADIISKPKRKETTLGVISFDAWKELEKFGAVFLPAAGLREDNMEIFRFNDLIRYWTSTMSSEKLFGYELIYSLDGDGNVVRPTYSLFGLAVRLVRIEDKAASE